MKYLIVLILASLAAGKVGVQSNYAKKHLKGNSDTTLFNAFIFLTSALIFSPTIVGASLQTILFAVGFACFTVVFQLTYTKALSSGNVSLTVMLVNLSILFPVLLSALYFKEPFSVFRIIGIILTFISFSFNINFQKKEPVSKKWFLLTILAMFANGAIGVIQKFFGASPYSQEKAAFVSWAYVFASLLAFIIFILIKGKEKSEKPTFSKPFFISAILVGCLLGCFQLLNTHAIATLDGTFLFPTYAGGSIILSTLLSFLWFREKLSFKQFVSLIIGIVAIIFMNF